jgi:hypothetical protein
VPAAGVVGTWSDERHTGFVCCGAGGGHNPRPTLERNGCASQGGHCVDWILGAGEAPVMKYR